MCSHLTPVEPRSLPCTSDTRCATKLWPPIPGAQGFLLFSSFCAEHGSQDLKLARQVLDPLAAYPGAQSSLFRTVSTGPRKPRHQDWQVGRVTPGALSLGTASLRKFAFFLPAFITKPSLLISSAVTFEKAWRVRFLTSSPNTTSLGQFCSQLF